MPLDPRTPFDSVPEAFDRWRPRYCDELFDRVAERAALGPGRRSLEVVGAYILYLWTNGAGPDRAVDAHPTAGHDIA